MRQRIIEWQSEVNNFHLEFYCDYEEKWRLRLFENGTPCIFKTMDEAKTYATEKPIESKCIIHNL